MENFSPGEVARKILDSVQKQYKELSKLNIMILGKTGVGKSTLINNMFGQQITETGVGRPVTDRIRMVEKPDFPLAIYDTPGLELSGENDVDHLLQEVVDILQTGVRTGDVKKAIHCIWYCVSVPSHRFEQGEADFLRAFLEKTRVYNVPVILVLTQSYSNKDTKAMIHAIEKENLNIVGCVPVLAEDYEINEEYTVRAYGLNKLATLMSYVIPDAVQKTFVALQCANMELKKEKARAVVAASAATAAATGAAPIPFADAALLVPEQISMLAGITAVYGIPMQKASLVAIVSATIGTTGTTVLGRTVVANITKLIPGVGSVVGGAISGSTAAALTAALGEAYIVILSRIAMGEMKLSYLETETGRQEITRLFTEQLKLRRQKEV